MTGQYGMVGLSEPMRRVYTILDRLTANVAAYAPCVVIHGERGTGKELVAKAIHQYGPRKDKPFVAFNCGAVVETLMEAELFGYTRGSFTGALRDRKGLFQEAHSGTLFIDEVTEMSSQMQVKLLRALQERKVRPVGSNEDVPYDAHILFASSKPLDDVVREGRFRHDLYDRVNVVRIGLPPLRERGDDIVLLTDYFVGLHAERARKGRLPYVQRLKLSP